ncbi:hypothetical protein FA13DRAFT_1516673 [Coprinellus micaceus]|uniref:Uncharacterized protein n=1 Tax=Coprinellus micaceus TaxID=71717 RepID=A0A4Y7SMF3_COPMI|nr:hypothetical protein FA13DRAFT_1516673 [Coprinellus micaceus]
MVSRRTWGRRVASSSTSACTLSLSALTKYARFRSRVRFLRLWQNRRTFRTFPALQSHVRSSLVRPESLSTGMSRSYWSSASGLEWGIEGREREREMIGGNFRESRVVEPLHTASRWVVKPGQAAPQGPAAQKL